MSGSQTTDHQGDVAAARGVPPMRDLSFSMLSLLIEAAASHLRISIPASELDHADISPEAPNLGEARVAIDAANALLASVRTAMENDAVLAVEGMLTQLQIEYVHRMSRTS